MLTRNLKNNNTNSDNNNDNVEGEIEKAGAHNIFTFLLLIVVSVLTYNYLRETNLSYSWVLDFTFILYLTMTVILGTNE